VIALPATIRPYLADDEIAAIDLWQRTWQVAYPAIDFSTRRDWWRQRWRDELVPQAAIMIAEAGGQMVGFVTVDSKTGYLDQIVVDPRAWGMEVGTLLLAEAQRLSPQGLDLHVNQDNMRAIRFYEKQGFTISGQDVNPRSGALVHKMSWRP
jgi:putative acetyltransferase